LIRRRNHGISKPLAQGTVNLFDLRDLLGRGKKEGGEAFPWILPEDSQAREGM
jgi:hypothetical protein